MENNPDNTSETQKGGITNYLSMFIPSKGYFITPILVDLNILIFLIMSISGVNIMEPDVESLLRWGANYGSLTLSGEWWRLLTCCFIHIGIIHLLLNMYALLYIGAFLEPLIGRARFLSAYLLSGIMASITSLWWDSFRISAGASGAIFGMYGVFLALLCTSLIEKSVRKQLLYSISFFIGYNLLYGIKDGIDNAAHIGGLLTGALIGFVFVPGLKREGSSLSKNLTIIVLSAALLIISGIVYSNIPNDMGKYDQAVQQFISTEEEALKCYHLPQSASLSTQVKEVENGLVCWKKNLDLMDSFDTLNLPGEIQERNGKLKEYCQLRINSYELLLKSLKENTDSYDKEILSNDEKIGKLLDDLSN